MAKEGQRRKWEKYDKIFFWIATLAVTGLMASQTASELAQERYIEKLVKSSEKSNEQSMLANQNSIKLNTTMEFVLKDLGRVTDNQKNHTKEIIKTQKNVIHINNQVNVISKDLKVMKKKMTFLGNSQTRIVKNLKADCRQANEYWSHHQRDCSKGE